jgi:hypothetical protein
MDVRVKTFGYVCDVCSGVAITVPQDLHDDAVVTCRDCGADLGTWGSLKAAATRAIRSETGKKRGRFSADPLFLKNDLAEG